MAITTRTENPFNVSPRVPLDETFAKSEPKPRQKAFFLNTTAAVISVRSSLGTTEVPSVTITGVGNQWAIVSSREQIERLKVACEFALLREA